VAFLAARRPLRLQKTQRQRPKDLIVDVSHGWQQLDRVRMKRTTKIVVNGQTYDSVEQMPPEVRQQYLLAVRALGDANDNGVPDLLESRVPSGVGAHESIIYEGKKYKSRDELPPEARELLDRLPEPKPGENETQIGIRTTEVLPPQVSISSAWSSDDQPQLFSARAGVSPWLVGALVLAVLVLLFLWLSGIRPGALIGR
jgi:hypothetical protein